MPDSRIWFFVWCPARSQPKHRHPSKESAVAEAQRLAATSPNMPFYVLEAIGMSVRQGKDVTWTEYRAQEAKTA